MASTKARGDPAIPSQIRILHGALIDIVNVMNQPQRDEMMVREAGVSLDRALFPVLVRIERHGPIGVVKLADLVGRDYTTVSRQVARLESLGFVERQTGAIDRRVREASVTPAGKVATDAVDRARARIGRATFATWDARDVADLVRLVRRFADALTEGRDEHARRAPLPAAPEASKGTV